MFQIFMAAGLAVTVVILLYIWADIREILTVVKESKREILRSSLGNREALNYPNLREDGGKPEAQNKDGASEEEASSETLKASEEQILKEVLAEFLG